MAKQVSEILIKLGLQGVEGLDKLKGAFRELEKSIGPNNAAIERARQSIVAYGRDSRNTEQVIKGQIDALRGLQSQVERGSSTWAQLATDIEQFRQASRRTDSELETLRQGILAVTAGTNQSQASLRTYIADLGKLRSEASLTGSTFTDLGSDIAALTARLAQAEAQTVQTSRAFGRVLGQALASTSAGARKQLQDLQLLIAEQRQAIDTIDTLSQRERRLTHNIEARADAQDRLNRSLAQQRQLTYQESIRSGREGVRAGAAAFSDPSFLTPEGVNRRFGELPNTTAALSQELNELSERLANTVRGSTAYVDVSNRIADVQRELRRELTGTAEAFERLARAQSATERRGQKVAGIQEYYSTQGPLAPGVGGYRDPVTGAMIARGARTPDRIRVDEAAYGQPIGPQAFPEAGRRAQQSIESALDDVNRIYENAKIQRAEIQTRYDNLYTEKLLQGLDLEGQIRDKAFRDELTAFDRQLEARDRKRRGRLTTGQAVQAAGAAISGGIFGGPEGFVGGVGGAILGSAIPGLGTVGGSFAGAAAGAQVGMFRQQLGAAAEYAAEIRRLQTALQGVVYSFDDYRAALAAIESTSKQFNVPIQESTQQFTKLSAAVIGSGGTVADAEKTFKGLTASVLATGGSVNDVNGALTAAAQVFSKGKVTAEELRGQIGERLAGAFALFAESTGKSTKELDASLQSGEVSLNDFVKFVEFSLQKYGKTAQIIADSPEQAGARLELAMQNLQRSVGDALGPAGAAFQDFATRSINGLDRLINKLIELKAIQPGAGYYQQQVLSGGMSTAQLEERLLGAGAKETDLRRRAAGVGLGFMADLLPEIRAASKEAKILEEALVKIRAIEKETNRGKQQRKADETSEQSKKLGEAYLQALDQREEALANARIQREEQIAEIRKNAIEQSFQIERQLGDERRNIERDMQRIKREMEYAGGEQDRIRRLAAGEDPRVIEAEREAASISQKATEDKRKVAEDLQDKELQQSRTIADFQKNVAKQINDANVNYAKQVGTIQREYAKNVAKIIDEGSGAAGKRLEVSSKIAALYLQRAALNQIVGAKTGSVVGEPGGGAGYGIEQFMGAGWASELGRELASINQIDEQIQALQKRLQQVRTAVPAAPTIQPMAQPAGVTALPSIPYSQRIDTPGIQGAGQTTQMRQQQAQQQTQLIDTQALTQQLTLLSQVKGSSQAVLDSYNKQNREIQLQYEYLLNGVNPAIASQLAGLQANYEAESQLLSIRKEVAIASGADATKTQETYASELGALTRIYEQNRRVLAQYQERQELLQRFQSISSSLESSLSTAISNSVQVLVTGTGTIKQVLADMFRSIGESFVKMAADIIAKQLVMITLGAILKALGIAGSAGGGGINTTPGVESTAESMGYIPTLSAKGNVFAQNGMQAYAQGGVVGANGIQPFANGGIVTKPTFFKYAKGGAMQNGLMGEAGPEAIMPLSRNNQGRLGVDASGLREAMGGTPGQAAGSPVLNMSFQSTNIGGVEYVSRDQLEAAMAATRRDASRDGARRGMSMTLDKLQQSPGTRSRVGLR
jgi:tape measure domain-containing protein